MEGELGLSVAESGEVQGPGKLPAVPTFVSFLLVGAAAFVVTEVALFLAYDTSLLWFLPAKDEEAGIWFLEHPDIRLLIASVISVEAAIAFKFFAYEHWTFRERQRRGPMALRFLQLNGASALGALVTVATVNLLTPLLGLSPYISTPAGVLVSFMLNWVFSAHWIWPKHDHQTQGA